MPLQWPHQKEPAKDLKSRVAEDRAERAGGMQKQLRFDALDVRRIEQQFKQVTE